MFMVMRDETLQQLRSFVDISDRRHAQQSSEAWLKKSSSSTEIALGEY